MGIWEYIIPWVGIWAMVLLMIRLERSSSSQAKSLNILEQNFSLMLTSNNTEHRVFSEKYRDQDIKIKQVSDVLYQITQDNAAVHRLVYKHEGQLELIEKHNNTRNDNNE